MKRLVLAMVFVVVVCGYALGGIVTIKGTPNVGESLATSSCTYVFVNSIQDPTDLTPPEIDIYRGGMVADLQYRLVEIMNLTSPTCGVIARESGNGEFVFNGFLETGPDTDAFNVEGATSATYATAYLQFLRLPYDGDTIQVGQDGPFPFHPITLRFTTMTHAPDPNYVDFPIEGITTLEGLEGAVAEELNGLIGTTESQAIVDVNTEGGIFLASTNEGPVGNSNYLIGHASASHCFRLTSWAGGAF